MNQELIEYMKKNIESLDAHPKIKEAMAYSLISNGKMIRPLIFLLFLKDSKLDYKEYLNVAMAIEMIHTYSLIHDDLPAMDDDDLRRGKKTNHVIFGEDFAILAGDSLLTHAFELIAKTKVDAKIVVDLIKETTNAAGVNHGMINGQVLDILNEENLTLDMLKTIHHQKTARLIELPLIAGALVTEEYEKIPKLRKLATDFGIAFQVRDDYLDRYGKQSEIGKTLGKDAAIGKKTYVDFYSKSEIEIEMKRLTKSVITIAKELNLNDELIQLFKKLEKREA